MLGGLQGGAHRSLDMDHQRDNMQTWKNLQCKTSDLTNTAKGEGESRIFVPINVRRSTGNPCKRERGRKMRKRESNKFPLDWGLGSWLDGPKRLIKMEFLMLIFVFSQKGWHILERHTACIFNGKSLHIFSSTPHCLVPCVTTARCSHRHSRRIAAHYLSLSALSPAPFSTYTIYGS